MYSTRCGEQLEEAISLAFKWNFYVDPCLLDLNAKSIEGEYLIKLTDDEINEKDGSFYSSEIVVVRVNAKVCTVVYISTP